jgi:hypothetical protein
MAQIQGSAGYGSGANTAIVNDIGQLLVAGSGTGNIFVMGTENSFTGSIIANGSYVGTLIDVKDYATISALINSSNTGSLFVDYSLDGVTVDRSSSLIAVSGQGIYHAVTPRARYARFRFMNGGNLHNPFSLQTMYSSMTRGQSCLPVIQPVTDYFTLLSTRAIISAKKPDGVYTNIDATAGGNLKVSVEDWDSAVGSVCVLGVNGNLTQDKSSGDLSVITQEHHEIHDGNHFNVRGFTTLPTSGNTICFGVLTPTGSKWTHFLFDVEGTTQTEVRIWEGATLSGGTAVIAFNNNRNSTNVSNLTIRANPVISGLSATSGLLLASHSKGLEGTTPSKASQVAQTGREDEWIFKSGTSYLTEIKSVGAGNIVDYAATWYEYTDLVKQW